MRRSSNTRNLALAGVQIRQQELEARNRSFGCGCVQCKNARAELIQALQPRASLTPPLPTENAPKPPAHAPPKFNRRPTIPEDAPLTLPFADVPRTTIRVFRAQDLPILERPAAEENIAEMGSVFSTHAPLPILDITTPFVGPLESCSTGADQVTHISRDLSPARAITSISDFDWCDAHLPLENDPIITDRSTRLFDMATASSVRSDASWAPNSD